MNSYDPTFLPFSSSSSSSSTSWWSSLIVVLLLVRSAISTIYCCCSQPSSSCYHWYCCCCAKLSLRSEPQRAEEHNLRLFLPAAPLYSFVRILCHWFNPIWSDCLHWYNFIAYKRPSAAPHRSTSQLNVILKT